MTSKCLKYSMQEFGVFHNCIDTQLSTLSNFFAIVVFLCEVCMYLFTMAFVNIQVNSTNLILL